MAHLPPESATANLAHADEPKAPGNGAQGRALAPVKVLSDVPVARSLREAGSFVNADGEEFTKMAGEAG